jgi:hypothetical protein
MLSGMLLHDPHTIPEPILVLSGLSYLAPAYVTCMANQHWSCFTYLYLTFTTVGFHATRNEFFFFLDCLAILNFLVHSSYRFFYVRQWIRIVYTMSIIYSLTSYLVGMNYKIMSFHPDWNTQMLHYCLMHLSTAYSAYLCSLDFKKYIK